jgi:hypothetical protein
LRSATRIVANVTGLGDYDDHRPDLIQSKTKKLLGRTGGLRAGSLNWKKR